jgi:hypothetical protein
MNVKVNGQTYQVKKAEGKKKYVVYFEGKIISRFGDSSMQQYKDKFGKYSHLDHNDSKRRDAFRSRFRSLYEKNKDNPRSAIYWSWNYLW